MSLLNNKVAIVTGASSGIGAAIAEKFAEEGAKVTMVGSPVIRDQTKLISVAQNIEKKGGNILTIIADVTDEDDCKRILKTTVDAFGKLDILVNNAGICNNSCILKENCMQIFDKLMSTNLRSCVFMTHLAAPHLIETRGNVINMSSVAGKSAYLSYFAYATSKAALDHFTRCVAIDLSEKGVRVNAINPGPVKTDIIENMGYDKNMIDAMWEDWRKTTTLDRISDAEEIADLAAFLASDKARSITGSTYVADNGALLKSGCF